MDISASKKRKLCHEEDEEEDEAKMEKFFALVRSIRENRDRWIGRKNKRSGNKKEEINRAVAVWRPTFQIEDFVGDEEAKRRNSDPSGSKSKSCGGEQEEPEKGIDLRLSL
ncbi:hypothetical protein RJT34_23168 [Clitoria ternatea]|uniref:Uncharacterized protein n=1 Tax=Clitoria ternatea TaxID=43366 RepID=A0AAN9FSA7_CLITE